MSRGAPSKYNEKYLTYVDEYLKEAQDQYEQLTRQENAEKGYVMFENKLSVNLPTIEGYLTFIENNYPKDSISEKTIYNWKDKYPEFLQSLGKILREQKRRLMNHGLDGSYNSTIAKLILSANHGLNETTVSKNYTAEVSKEEMEAMDDLIDKAFDE